VEENETKEDKSDYEGTETSNDEEEEVELKRKAVKISQKQR